MRRVHVLVQIHIASASIACTYAALDVEGLLLVEGVLLVVSALRLNS